MFGLGFMDYLFALLGTLSAIALLAWMATKKRVIDWISVSLFCLVKAASDVLLWYFLYCNRHKSYYGARYFYTFWFSNLLLTSIKVGILAQIVRGGIVNPMRHLSRLSWVPAALIIVPLTLAMYSGFAASSLVHTSYGQFAAFSENSGRSASIGFATIFALFAVWGDWLGLKWKSEPLLADLGLTVLSLGDLQWFLVKTFYKGAPVWLLDRISTIFFLATIGIWAAAFSSHRRTPEASNYTSEIEELNASVDAEADSLEFHWGNK